MLFHFDNSYAQLPTHFFVPVNPTIVPNPTMFRFNSKLAKELDLEIQNEDEFAAFFSGNKLLPNSFPLAQAYAGHQFGNFTMLGDGRAILLGEHLTKKKERFDVQLKGAGSTAFSRGGDGRATLRAMLREYIISEAMAGLKIPTSRSLAVVNTGSKVYREEIHEGAVLTRIASSHIRVGTFEFVNHFLSKEELNLYVDYVYRHYPEIINSKNKALDLLRAVMEKQVNLIVQWMGVGFIHGVMNTDNMSIAGETFDYGPCAFMNTYHQNTVFSSIDHQGRYAYGNQPRIAHWNLACLAGSMLRTIHEKEEMAVEMAQEVIHLFPKLYESKWQAMMFKKLGFSNLKNEKKAKRLIQSLLEWMTTQKADYTNTFLVIQGDYPFEGIYLNPDFQAWYEEWKSFIQENETASYKEMRENNPSFIPRNHLVEQALDEVTKENKNTLFNQLLDLLENPYLPNKNFHDFQSVPDGIDQTYQTFCGT